MDKNVWPPDCAVWNVRLFGRLEVVSASKEIARFQSRTALSLFAFLLVNKANEYSHDQLYGLFWPDRDGDRQAQNLRRAIADLRKVLERGLPLGSVIVTRKSHVSLRQDRIATDVEKFLELTHPSPSACSQERLAEAIGLYSGPLLAPISASWTLDRRMELEERYGQAVNTLCKILIEQASLNEAINIGRAAVVIAPNREDVHIALMQAYRSAGMEVEALRQFEELERILDETWGEAPSLRAREALEATFEDSHAGMHNLPAQLTSFIGRKDEIKEVLELLSHTRLLTLTGSGGCGKTRLSLQVADKMLGKLRDGVWFVAFAALSAPNLVAQTTAAVFEVHEEPGKAVEQTLIEHLESKRLLLVFDNCEHLIGACAHLADSILRRCPGVRILASSREALAIGGEQCHRVPSMSLPGTEGPIQPEGLLEYEAVSLFVDRARAFRPFDLTEVNAPPLVSICRRLDGIPLAIELAASRTRSMSLEDIERNLDKRFELLTGGSRVALPRQQTLRALIEWSFDLLADQEKRLFERLSVFAGGFTMDAAERICSGEGIEPAEVFSLLTALVDKSLVVAYSPEGTSRYTFLESVRQYAWDRLGETGTADVWRLCHAEYFAELARAHQDWKNDPDPHAHHQSILREVDNLRVALAFGAEANGPARLLVTLCASLAKHWGYLGMFSEGKAWMAEALKHRGNPAVHDLWTSLLLNGGWLAHSDNESERARGLYKEAASLSTENPENAAYALCGLGLIRYVHDLDIAGACDVFEDAIRLIGQESEFWLLQSLRLNLGAALRDCGRYLSSEEHMRWSLNSMVPGSHNRANCLMALGRLNHYQCKFEHVEPLLRDALEIKARLGIVPDTLAWLATHFLDIGEYEKARDYFEESAAQASDLSSRIRVSYPLAGLCWSLAKLKRLEGSGSALRQSFDCLSRSGPDHIMRSTAFAFEAGVALGLACGMHLEAAQMLGAAIQLREADTEFLHPYLIRRHENFSGELKQQLSEQDFNESVAVGRTLSVGGATKIIDRLAPRLSESA